MRLSLGLATAICALAVSAQALSQAIGVGPAATFVPGPQSGYSAWGQILYETNPGDLQNITFQSSGGGRTSGIWNSNSSTFQGVSKRISFANDPPDATANTSASTAAGSVTLIFAAVPALAVSGGYVTDLTHRTAILAGTTIASVSTGSATVTLSGNVVSPGVANGDQIVFYGPIFSSRP